MINLDLGGVARPSYTPLPDGDYTLLLSDLTVKPGKSDPAKMIAHCVYEVVEPAEFEGRKILHWQQLNGDGNSMGFTKIWIEALIGEPLDGEVSIDPEDLIGKHCEAHVKIVPDNRDAEKKQNAIGYFKLPFDADNS